jgi:hypothetical protein
MGGITKGIFWFYNENPAMGVPSSSGDTGVPGVPGTQYLILAMFQA